MPSYNRVVLIGRLTRDPELRYTTGGLAMCKFSIAVDRQFKNQQGERVTDFFDCTAWRQKAEFVSNYIGRGRLVCVEGRIEINEAAGQDGQKRKFVNIVADNVEGLDSQREGSGGGGEGGGYNRGGGGAPMASAPMDDAGGYFPDEEPAQARGGANRAPAAAPRAQAPAPRRAPAPIEPEDDFDDSDPFADH